ncbi:hypothetical protein [Actinospica robiniae]|uniref:hypothetical protein n=1 Tax=Actinospica robiniae TaxID=304901 RepID=UPI000429FA3F|nr:hypothetical protein [Actinospica robiniae]
MDYAFLVRRPKDQWWDRLADASVIFTDGLEVAVKGAGDGCEVMICGVPSKRRDAVGTAIRYTLLLELGIADSSLAAPLVRCALGDASRADLGAGLDELFDAETVDRILSAQTAGDEVLLDRAGEAVAEIVNRAAAAESNTARGGVPGSPWAGSAEDETSVDAFLGYVAEVAHGGKGLAFTSHAVQSLDRARQVAQQFGPDLVLLVADAPFEGIKPLGKAEGSADIEKPAPISRVGILGLALCGLIVLLLIIWWVRRA